MQHFWAKGNDVSIAGETEMESINISKNRMKDTNESINQINQICSGRSLPPFPFSSRRLWWLYGIEMREPLL